MADDFYNGAEDATAETLRNDPWLGDVDNIKEIEVGLSGDGGNSPLFDSKKVPAIACECLGEAPSTDDETLSERGLRLSVVIEVVHYSDQLRPAKRQVKSIAARISQLISRQKSEANFPDQATHLNGFAREGIIEYPNDVVLASGPRGQGWLILALIRFYVRIFDPN